MDNGLFLLASDTLDRGEDEMDLSRLTEFSNERLKKIEIPNALPR